MPAKSSLCRSSRIFSLLCAAGLLPFLGCGRSGEYQEVTSHDVKQAESHADDHNHHHDAPHGGHLIELGDHQYSAEAVLEENGRLVVYLADAHAKHAVPVALEQIEFAVDGGPPIVLTAEPQEGDPEGQASRFVASGDAVTIDDIEDLRGNLQVEIEGTNFSGELSHDHDDHDHGHDH